MSLLDKQEVQDICGHTACMLGLLKKEERRRRMPNRDFYFARCVRNLRYYSDVIHSFNWISAIEHDGGV